MTEERLKRFTELFPGYQGAVNLGQTAEWWQNVADQLLNLLRVNKEFIDGANRMAESLKYLEEQAKQHQWELLTSSLSGTWQCKRCNKVVDGGPHDGSGYYPGKGQDVGDCPGKISYK